MTTNRPVIDKSLIGAAGVHYVVSELSLRGLIALPTIKNTRGFDVIVTNREGTWHANLQVKTSSRKVPFWPVGKGFDKLRGKRNYYAFLRYLKKESRFEVFLESADRVADEVAKSEKEGKEQGFAEWAPCWYLPKKEKKKERLLRNWNKFGGSA